DPRAVRLCGCFVAAAVTADERGEPLESGEILEHGDKLSDTVATRHAQIQSREAQAAHPLAQLRQSRADVGELRSRELHARALLRGGLFTRDGIESVLQPGRVHTAA